MLSLVWLFLFFVHQVNVPDLATQANFHLQSLINSSQLSSSKSLAVKFSDPILTFKALYGWYIKSTSIFAK